VAKLPSGGSIVINPTEALVSIDVNSGRATKERHIDETALKTNLEAADEIARQMRLRDLAGLVVIDFIDMSEQKHIQAVEKRLREATSRDRARIQLGHISQFGLLEMSRQRLRPSLIETNSSVCHHCQGTGVVRSVESMSLLVLRAIENEGIGGRSAEIAVTVPAGVDLYLLNQKRSSLVAVENRYQMRVTVARDDTLISPEFRIESLAGHTSPVHLPQPEPISVPEIAHEEGSDEEEKNIFHKEAQGERNSRRRRRRRPFRRGQNDGDSSLTGRPFTGEEHLQSPPSIEEQIVTEIMGSVQTGQETPGGASQRENKQEARAERSEKDHGRRRRRRGRHPSQRHSSHNEERKTQQEKETALSPSGASGASGAANQAKTPADPVVPLKKENHGESKDVAVPITSLPEGLGASSRKSSQGRWWKRLLES
jgi:ribonuclease E